MKHTPLESLPIDRAFLHFESVRLSFDSVQVDYELVIPLEKADCRGTFDRKGRESRPKSFRSVWLDKANNKRIPLGRTTIGTSNQNYPFSSFDGSIDLPFRDGVHQLLDNEKLGGLPLIYSFEGKHWTLERTAT